MKRSISPAVLTAVLILAAAALLVLQLGGYLNQFQDALTSPLVPIQTWISIRFSAVRDMISSPRDIASLRVQNAELEAEVARLQREVISLQEEIAESQILSALLIMHEIS